MNQDKHKTTFKVCNMDPHNEHTSQGIGGSGIALIFHNRVPVCTPKCTSVLFFLSFEKLLHRQHSYANLNSNQIGKASNANVIDKIKVLGKQCDEGGIGMGSPCFVTKSAAQSRVTFIYIGKQASSCKSSSYDKWNLKFREIISLWQNRNHLRTHSIQRYQTRSLNIPAFLQGTESHIFRLLY